MTRTVRRFPVLASETLRLAGAPRLPEAGATAPITAIRPRSDATGRAERHRRFLEEEAAGIASDTERRAFPRAPGNGPAVRRRRRGTAVTGTVRRFPALASGTPPLAVVPISPEAGATAPTAAARFRSDATGRAERHRRFLEEEAAGIASDTECRAFLALRGTDRPFAAAGGGER